MKKVIVIVQDSSNKERQHYFGPFKNGDVATHWASSNCRGFEWHWEEINPVRLPKDV